MLLFNCSILLPSLQSLHGAEKLKTKNKENHEEENREGELSTIEDLDDNMKDCDKSKQFDGCHEDIPADEEHVVFDFLL